MKLQLTKDKTIEIKLPGGGGGRKSASDITGVELFSSEPNGCPAVRLVYRKKAWHIAAAKMIPAPNGEMPQCWEDTPKQPKWELPKEFTSPHAALAVNSAMGVFGQSTAEAVIQEMMTGLAAQPNSVGVSKADPGKKRFGVKRDGSPAPEKPAASAANARRPEFPHAGVPVSENGRRFAVRPLGEDGFHLSVSLPEFQALWLSRLLPEGRRPTASSIQLAEASLMSSVLLQPAFREAKGSALVVFVLKHAIFFAGYKNGQPVLWRCCPGANGSLALRAAVKKTLGLDDELVDSVLNESIIDPRPALEPFIRPVFSQLELALAYLAGKQALKIDRAFLVGLNGGAARHLSELAQETLHITLQALDPFEGFIKDKGVEVEDATPYLSALGAAIAGAEVEL